MLYLTDDQPKYPEQGCSLQVYVLVTHHIKCHLHPSSQYVIYMLMIYIGLSLCDHYISPFPSVHSYSLGLHWFDHADYGTHPLDTA